MAAIIDNRYGFGDFEVNVERRLLLRDGEVVPLKAKTFDLLLALVENRGTIVSKRDLMDMVWEDQFVEENNLTVHVAALRKALGETKNDHRFIVTVPGKGYRFVAEHNGSGNGNVVVESRKFQRIVVEDFEEVDEAVQPRRLKKAAGWTSAIAASLLAGIVWFAWYSLTPATADRAEVPVPVKTFATSGIPHRVAISPDGRTVAYVRRMKGKDSIWIGDIDTNSNIQITPDSNRLHESLYFSADGRTIFFLAREDAERNRVVMSVPAFGGAARELLSNVLAIAPSPDGRRIAYLKPHPETGQNSLYSADAASGGDETLHYSPVAPARIAYNEIAFVPKGDAVTLPIAEGEKNTDCAFFNVSLKDGTVERIPGDSCRESSNLVWLADGSRIATITASSEHPNGQVWVHDIRSGERTRLTDDSGRYLKYSLTASANGRIAVLEMQNRLDLKVLSLADRGVTESVVPGSTRDEGNFGVAAAPDGKLLFTALVGRSLTIRDVARDGSNEREIVPAGGETDNSQVHVSPDNRYIVFQSNRSGTPQIWRADRNGGGLVQLTQVGENSAPVISPDGQRVLYHSLQDKVYNVWSMPIGGGEATQLSTTNCTWPDVSPDGRFFICATGTAVDGPKRTIMLYDSAGGQPIRTFKVVKNSSLYNRIRWTPDGKGILYKDTVDGLWLQDIESDEPVKLPGFEDERVFHFAFDQQGRLVYSGGTQMRKIVILEPKSSG